MDEKQNNEENVCAICLATSVDSRKEQLECGHVFCCGCIGKWRKTAATSCPLCRATTAMVRIYFCASDTVGIGAVLLEREFSKRFGEQFCEPLSVSIGGNVATVFFVSERAFCEQVSDFFVSFGYECVDLTEVDAAKFGFLDARNDANDGLCNAKVLRETADPLQTRITTRVKLVREEAMQRAYSDPRIRQLHQNNNATVARRLFPLYGRMIEYEVAHDEPACAPLSETPSDFALTISPMATAIAREQINNPVAILDRFGDEWRTAADNIPLSEIEHVRCAMRNLAASQAQEDASRVPPLMHENEARSIVLFNRVRLCVCACCAKRLLANGQGDNDIQCCKRCRCAFYCSEECYLIDLCVHMRTCCNPAARRARGVLEMTLANDSKSNVIPGAVQRGQHHFSSDQLQAALNNAL